MFQSNFVLSIKDNHNQVLRESNGNVFMPFNQEYSLFLKNKNSTRASASIKIDGTDVLGGKVLIIPAYGCVDVERFLVDGNLLKGNKFKFVPLTDSNVQDPTSAENGLIEVTFTHEQSYFKCDVIAPIQVSPQHPWIPQNPYQPWFYCGVPTYAAGTTANINTLGALDMKGSLHCRHVAGTPILPSATTTNVSLNDCCLSSKAGATVEGSLSNQSFVETSNFIPSADVSPVTLKLRIVAAEESVTVKGTKTVYCSSCGYSLKWEDKYCSCCGKKTTHKP